MKTWLLLILSSLFCVALQAQTIRYVKENGAGNGSTWTNASGDLQAMLAASADGDQVWVAAGTYYPGANRTDAFVLKSGVKLLGGFPNSGEPGMEDRNYHDHTTFLSGDIGSPNQTNDNTYHVVVAAGDLGVNALFDGFTISGGNANSAGNFYTGYNGFNIPGNKGGGLVLYETSLKIENIALKNNRAAYGGGLSIYGGEPVIRFLDFEENTATQYGGGLYADKTIPTIISSVFYENEAAQGGGIYANASTLTVVNGVISFNGAELAGGGVSLFNDSYAPSGSMESEFINCTVVGNKAASGGGFHVQKNEVPFALDLHLMNSIVYANEALVGDGHSFMRINASVEWRYSFVEYQNDIDRGNIPHQSPFENESQYDDVEPPITDVKFNKIFNPKGDDGRWRTQDDGLYFSSVYGMTPGYRSWEHQDFFQKRRYGKAALKINIPDEIDYDFTNHIRRPGETVPMGAYDAYCLANVSGGILYVKQNRELINAIADASLCGITEIWVAEGEYSLSNEELLEGIKIYGGFPITETPETLVFSDRNTELTPSIIVIEGNHPAIYNGIDITRATVIDGFVFEGRDNTAGAILNYAGSPTISNCKFINNKNNLGGGAIRNESFASPFISNCDFENNTTLLNGGAILNDESDPIIENSRFYKNQAALTGGGVSNRGERATATFTNVQFNENTAGTGGAGMANTWATAIINGCSFARNITEGNGGGILNSQQQVQPLIVNTFFYENEAGNGGGIANTNEASSAVTNCTFYGNRATAGAAMYNNSGTHTMANSIIKNNYPDGVSYQNSSFTVQYSLVQDLPGGENGNIDGNTDPLFYMPEYAYNSNGKFNPVHFKVKLCSPIMEAGSNDLVPQHITTDASNNLRIQHGIVDMGANENVYSNLCMGVDSIYVNVGTSYDDYQRGCFPDKPMKLLNTALSRANGQECTEKMNILVAEGIYYPISEGANTNRESTFIMASNVNIYGGFPATGTFKWEERDWNIYPTILSGDIGVSNDSLDNTYHVLTYNEVDTTHRLDGFVITGGTANGTQPQFEHRGKKFGGGMYMIGSSPIIANTRFYKNSAGVNGGGGAVMMDSSSPTFINNTFDSNNSLATGSIGGGAVQVSYYSSHGYSNGPSFPTFLNCTFTNNQSNSGGAINSIGDGNVGLINIVNSHFENNGTTAVQSMGGAISSSNAASVSVSQSNFVGNQSTSGGGAIYFRNQYDGRFLTVTGSHFTENNTTNEAGGAIYLYHSNGRIADNIFLRNKANTIGGAIHTTGTLSNRTIDIVKNEFDSNTANSGGAICNNNQAGQVIIDSSLFTVNKVSLYGGAIYNIQTPKIVIQNSKFGGNTATASGGAITNNSSGSTITNNQFVQNKALVTGSGGAISNEGGGNIPTYVNRSFFYQNSANGSGGAISNAGVNVTIANSVFSGNEALGTSNSSGGGAIYNSGTGKAFRIINNTIYRNTATTILGGGGIKNYATSADSVMIYNSVIAANIGSGVATNSGGVVTIKYSLVQGVAADETNIDGNANPMFANNNDLDGNDNLFSTIDDGLIPQQCSPLINNGNNEYLALLPDTLLDIKAKRRIGMGKVDIGAYESLFSEMPIGWQIPDVFSRVFNQQNPNSSLDYANTCDEVLVTLSGDASGTAINGIVTVQVWVEDVQPQGFAKRHFEITPSVNPETATGNVKLYFLQSEFDAYNYEHPNKPKLPSGPPGEANLTAMKNIVITKYSGSSNNGSGLPNSYESSPVRIPNEELTITWNAASQIWEVSFDVTGFSGFFLSSEENSGLPLTLLSFTASEINCQAQLQWKTTNEVNVFHYEIEQSYDGVSFIKVKSEKATGRSDSHYQTMVPISNEHVYFRLKMIDIDGSYAYSPITLLSANCHASSILLYPNPAVNTLTVQGGSTGDYFSIYSLDGKKIITGTILNKNYSIDVSKLTPGNYYLQTGTQTGKFIKQ